MLLDYFTNKPIKLKYPIKPTDTLAIIKEKIFISSSNFIALNTIAISDGKKYITDDKQLTDTSNLIVFNLAEELTKNIFEDVQKFLSVSINSQIITSLYKGYQSVYVNLTRNTLYYTVLNILKNAVNLNSNNYELSAWLKEQKNAKDKLLDKYDKLLIDQFKANDYLIKDKNGYIYNILSTIVYYTLKIDKNSNRTLLRILKEYPLSNDIPIMIMSTSDDNDNTNPVVKIYKDFSNEMIAEWYLKKGQDSFKKTRGLVFKMKLKNDNYCNVMLVPENNKISIRCSWKSTDNIRYNDILQSIKHFDKFIDVVQGRIISNIEIKDPIIGYINTQFQLKKQVPLQKIVLASKLFAGIFKLDENEKKKEFVKLVYQPDSITMIFRYTNVITNNITSKINIVDLLGVKSERQLIYLMETIARLVSKAEEQKDILIFKDFKYQKISNEALKDRPVPNLNIKQLKQEGIPIDTVSCQKERQPKIVPVSDFVYKGNKIACNNKPYIYPGFTNKNILCCFKKDQRKKPSYIRNMGEKDKVSSNDEKIIKSRVITSDKILDENRLGLLPPVLDGIFNNNSTVAYFRLGYLQNENTLESILQSTSKKMSSSTDLEDKYKVNIFIFNMLTNSVSCKDNLHLPYDNTVFIIKNDNTYELIVKRKTSSLQRTFNKTDNTILKTILDIYKKSCIVKYSDTSVVPLNFVELLSKGIEIISQVITPFNKVIYINTKDYGVLPVLPTKPITNVKIQSINAITLSPDTQISKLSKLKNIEYLELTGQIKDITNTYTLGLVTKSGLIIPTKKEKSKSTLPLVYRQFVQDIDTLIYNKVSSNNDKRYEYMLTVNYYKELYNRLKYTLSKTLTKEIKDAIMLAIKTVKNSDELHIILKKTIEALLDNEVVIVETVKIPKVKTKRNVCSTLSLSMCTNDVSCKISKGKCLLAIEKNVYKAFIERLSVEIIWNKDIINGRIIEEFYGDNKFIKRKNEVILLTQDEINKYFNRK